jgi:hypothetical protein
MKSGWIFRFLASFACFFFILTAAEPPVNARTAQTVVPIGQMVSKGDVKFEAKGKGWRKVEANHFPLFTGMKLKTEKGTALIALANNTQIEVSQNSLISFPQENQVYLLHGTLNFRIPHRAETKFPVGDVSVVRYRPLEASKNPSGLSAKLEEAIGSMSLRTDGSLTLSSSSGAVSVLDKDRNVLATVQANEAVKLPSTKVMGKQRIMLAQVGDLTPEQKRVFQKLEGAVGADYEEVDALETYLLDFSKALKGKPIPPDLDAEKFFETLEKYYPHQDIIDKVKEYPVRASNEGDSYELLFCDKQSQYRLYGDRGLTTRQVDYPYWPERRLLECEQALDVPEEAFIAIFAQGAMIGGFVSVMSVLDNKDTEDQIPTCP